MAAPKPTGPAADPKFPPSLAEDNPYGFPPQLREAAKLRPKITDRYLFFFGYEGEDPHVCLQQWFPSPFNAPRGGTKGKPISGGPQAFATTEQYMMYQKAVLMGDDEIATKILQEAHPSAAKKLGREVRNFDLDKWTANADQIVEDANYFKFSQNEELKAILLGTGDREIVEASPDDKIWGIGFNSEDAEGREGEWGNNGLGKALMRVRERLRKEVDTPGLTLL